MTLTPRQALAFLGLVLAAGPALAGYAEGEAAFHKRDFGTAWRELEPLAKQGDAKAAFLVASMYQGGMGRPPNDLDAAKWYRAAADKGHDQAMFMLGAMYEGGAGVYRNATEALAWYRKSADKGFYTGQMKVVAMLAKGTGGLARDYNEAYMWLLIAEKGRKPGDKDLPEIERLKAEMKPRLTPAQLAEADRKAKAWKQK